MTIYDDDVCHRDIRLYQGAKIDHVVVIEKSTGSSSKVDDSTKQKSSDDAKSAQLPTQDADLATMQSAEHDDEPPKKVAKRTCFIKTCGKHTHNMRKHILTQHLPSCFNSGVDMDVAERCKLIENCFGYLCKQLQIKNQAGLYLAGERNKWFPLASVHLSKPVNKFTSLMSS
jgi:hypothetical protein